MKRKSDIIIRSDNDLFRNEEKLEEVLSRIEQ